MLGTMLVFLQLGILVFIIFVLAERARASAGEITLTEKMITWLEDVHKRTAPQEEEEVNYSSIPKSEKIEIKRVYFREK